MYEAVVQVKLRAVDLSEFAGIEQSAPPRAAVRGHETAKDLSSLLLFPY